MESELTDPSARLAQNQCCYDGRPAASTGGLVAIGGMVDPWIDKARRPLHFGVLVEDWTLLSVIPNFMPDNPLHPPFVPN